MIVYLSPVSVQRTNQFQINAIVIVISVTGKPTLACSMNPICTLYSLACSMVIKLAILPMVIRLPAKVLTKASKYRFSVIVRLMFFKMSITAGTLLTMLLRATVTRAKENDLSKSIPMEKRNETICSGI